MIKMTLGPLGLGLIGFTMRGQIWVGPAIPDGLKVLLSFEV